MEIKELQRDRMIFLLRKKMDRHARGRLFRIGFLFLLLMTSLVVVSAIFVESRSFDHAGYNQGIADFTENENIALRIYDQMNNEEFDRVPQQIMETGIPYWLRNIEILTELNAMDQLPEELKAQNQILMDYCQLRIKAYVLIRKALIEKTSRYEAQLKKVHQEIEDKMEEMEIQTVMER